MDDAGIVTQIGRLADREHELERTGATRPLTHAERAEIADVEIQLDQCWDLLRQRRARRNAGLDPEEAEVRPAPIVENYRQ